MGRRNLTYVGQRDFRGGINLEPENASPNQVLDASNWWVRDGKLVKRPGAAIRDNAFRFPLVANARVFDLLADTSTGVETVVKSNPSQLFASEIGQAWYFGINMSTNNFVDNAFALGLTFSGTFLSFESTTSFQSQYWTGTDWKNLDSTRMFTVDASLNVEYIATVDQITPTTGYTLYNLIPKIPEDWSRVEFEGLERYWIRWIAVGEDVDAVDIDTTVASTCALASPRFTPVGLADLQFDDIATSLSIGLREDLNAIGFRRSFWAETRRQDNPDVVAQADEPATIAIIPEFQKTYVAYNHQVYDVPFSDPTDDADFRARVNSNPAIVGDEDGVQENDATYDVDTVAQLETFPEAKYIKYFGGFLWAAGIRNRPFDIRWSAPALDAAFDVWPAVSFEVLAQDDNSPITGLATLNEHLVVFKRESIWLMVNTGFNELGLAQFAPTKIASGIGAVSQASIQSVDGRLIFLAEDGFYAFNGTPQPEKLSSVIDEKVRQIVPSGRRFADAVHWRREKLYLCSVRADSATQNNLVFVFDYKHGGWWFWEDLNVEHWLELDDAQNEQRLQFADAEGRVLELIPENPVDSGLEINARVLTQRWGYGDQYTKRFRDFRVWSTNTTLGYDVTPVRQDQPQDQERLVFTDPAEPKWDTAVWDAVEWQLAKRRERHLRLRETSEWIQFEVEHNTAERPELYSALCGLLPLGVR